MSDAPARSTWRHGHGSFTDADRVLARRILLLIELASYEDKIDLLAQALSEHTREAREAFALEFTKFQPPEVTAAWDRYFALAYTTLLGNSLRDGAVERDTLAAAAAQHANAMLAERRRWVAP